MKYGQICIIIFVYLHQNILSQEHKQSRAPLHNKLMGLCLISSGVFCGGLAMYLDYKATVERRENRGPNKLYPFSYLMIGIGIEKIINHSVMFGNDNRPTKKPNVSWQEQSNQESRKALLTKVSGYTLGILSLRRLFSRTEKKVPLVLSLATGSVALLYASRKHTLKAEKYQHEQEEEMLQQLARASY